jgi:hypothetical protein
LFLDRTTQYDETDRDALVTGLEEAIRSIGIGDRVEIYTISDAFVNSELLFQQCMPGCPDVGLLEELVSECRPIIARQQALSFRAEILESLQEVVSTPRQYRYSAIVDTFSRQLAGMRLGSNSYVLVFSDMLENSPDLPWPAITEADGAEVAAGLPLPKPDLAGARVIVCGFGRDHSPARRPLPESVRNATETFWRTFFEQLGAGSVDISPRMQSLE